MTAATVSLTRQMLEWIEANPRTRTEVMEAWRTSCPRLSIWEDACLSGLVEFEAGSGRVTLSAAGRAFLTDGRDDHTPSAGGASPEPR